MIESLVINKILQENSLDLIREYDLTEEHFLTRQEELEFIKQHKKDYGNVPDETVFAEQFDDFEFREVNEDNDYLAYRLKEAKLYKDSVPIMKEAERLIREDSLEAVQYLKTKADDLLKESNFTSNNGYDIMANAEDRLEEYKERIEQDGLIGISTGISLLDEYTHGWLPEDLTVLFARTNQGKTWILLYWMIQAWLQDKKVLLYSGEMSKNIIGYRVDTLYQNWNNSSLMNGNTNLGDVTTEEVGERNIDDYEEYINDISDSGGFIVVTPRDFGHKPTVSELKGMMEYHNADILGVDQITLMRDEKNGNSKNLRYENIAQDLFLASEDMQKPVVAVHQASRESSKGKDDEAEPELEHLKWSGGIEENATRVISMVMVDGVLKLVLKKNRYGVNNKEVLMTWDINLGLLKPLLEGGDTQIEDYGF